MVLRPTVSAIERAGVRYLVFIVPGAVLVYAGWSSGVVVPALFGTLLLGLGGLAFANVAMARIRLDAGVLSGRTLLGRVSVPVDHITKVVPIDVTDRRPSGPRWGFHLGSRSWNRSVRTFEVCTSDGPVGLWLSPTLYGEAGIQSLLQEIHIAPEDDAEERRLDLFGSNRD